MFKNESCDNMLFFGLDKSYYNIIWNIVDIAMFVPTVFGNSLILISIFRFRRLRTKIHILIGHLAVNDLLVGATLLPLETLGNTYGFDHYKYFCLTKLSVFAMTLGGSIMGLLFISVERFSAVAFPLRHAHFTKRKLAIAMFCGWVYVITLTLSPIFGCNNYEDSNGSGKCNAVIVWGGWCKVCLNMNLFLGLVLNVIFYICVVAIAVKNVREHGRQTGTSTNLFKSREMSKTVTMAAVLGLFALFWFPYAMITLVLTVNKDCDQTMYYVRRWFLILGLFNSCINWLIYGLKNKDFKEAFKTILCCDRGVKRNNKVACTGANTGVTVRESQC